MKNIVLQNLVFLLATTVPLWGAPQSFDFKDPKGVNNVVFKLDAPLESINGTASGISGTVHYDPAAPASLKGRIVLATASLHVGNPTMKEHMHGKDWMDVAQHPEIVFEAISARPGAAAGDTVTADVTGKLTVKGLTKEMTIPVKLTYLKDRLKDRFPQKQGDLLVIRSTFKIKRSDFGINAGKAEDKVADEIELNLSLAGMAPR
ncbi:MAG TPA: YceI family protein [Methylomirabilota bacterium]|nr:YceI family protein [Methylomirabilota bacterium]